MAEINTAAAEATKSKLAALKNAIDTATETTTNDLTTALNKLVALKSEDVGVFNFMEHCHIKVDNNAIVLHECDNKDITALTIHPAVTKVTSAACKDLSELKKVTFSDNTTDIGNNAFNNSGVETVFWPTGNFSIGSGCFENCKNLPEDLTISATSIGAQAFGNTPIKSISLPSLQACGAAPLAFCENLTDIECENNVHTVYNNCLIHKATKELVQGCNKSTVDADTDILKIADYALAGFPQLESITIPEQVTALGVDVFNGCRGLRELHILNRPGITDAFKENLLNAANGCESLENLTLPCIPTVTNQYPSSSENGEQRLGAFFKHDKYGYQGSTVAHNSYVPESLKTLTTYDTEIGSYACENVDSLVEVTLPRAAVIGEYAFAGCASLEKLTVGTESTPLKSFDAPANIISWCNSLTEVYIYAESATGSYNDFKGTSNMKTGRIPSGWLYDTAKFSELENVECMGSSSTSGEGFAKLKTAAILNFSPPSNIKPSGEYTIRYIFPIFCNSPELETITLPNHYYFIDWSHPVRTNIQPDFLTGCPKLSRINYSGTTASWNNTDDFIRSAGWIDHDCPVFCTDGIATASGNEISTLYTTVTSSNRELFGYTSSITKLTIQEVIMEPNNVNAKLVNKIGESAFSGCTNLQSITIPATVTSIGASAFSGCTSLTMINFKGTKAQWSTVSRGINWDQNIGSYVVKCSDGIAGAGAGGEGGIPGGDIRPDPGIEEDQM